MLSEAGDAPNVERIQMLSKRLNNLSTDLESKKCRLVNNIEAKLKELIVRTEEAETDKNELYEALNDSIMAVDAEVKASHAELDKLSKAKTAEIKELDNEMQMALAAIKTNRKEYETKLITALDSKLADLKETIAIDGATFKGAIADRNTRITADLAQIEESVHTNKTEWETMCDNGLSQIEAKMRDLNEHVIDQKQAQEGMENRWLKRLDEMSNSLRGSLQEEQRHRTEAEDTLVALLESACIKIKEAEAL